MKKLTTLFLLYFITNFAHANYSWQQLTPLPSTGRVGVAGFSLGNKLYYGNGDYNASIQYNDIWQFDPATNSWSQMASLPGSLTRVSACAFSVNGFGYMGLGWNRFANAVALFDFYKYDPSLNSWTAIAQYPGTSVFNASSFVIGNMAYVGLGGSGNTSMYKYDPMNDVWTSIANYPGSSGQSSVAFSVNGYGYVFGGWDGSSAVNELWSYNPSGNSWSQKTSAPISGISPTAFVIDGYAFVGAGALGNQGGQVDFYQYYPTIDAWSNAPAFPGLPLAGFRGTVIGNTAYAFGGGDPNINFYNNQLWKFENASSIAEPSESPINVFYNAFNHSLEIRSLDNKNIKLNLFAMTGQKIINDEIVASTSMVSLSSFNLKPGYYLYSILDKNNSLLSSSKIFIY